MISPILLIIFNRPDHTAKVFAALKKAKPPVLYVSADGPRANIASDIAKCELTRQIISNIDWPCSVHTRFLESNLGCRTAVSTAIDWFFTEVEEGVILEDDCVPSFDFFNYCDLLLNKYRTDERIGLISGTAFMDLGAGHVLWDDEDYIYTRYPSIWGWATWRRVWKSYDPAIKEWPNNKKQIGDFQSSPKMKKINEKLLNKVFNNDIDTWDYQVSYLLWSTGRLSIVPKFNLISNIGFDKDATHTKWCDASDNHRFHASNKRMTFPLRPPKLILENIKYRRLIESYAQRSLFNKILKRIRSFFDL